MCFNHFQKVELNILNDFNLKLKAECGRGALHSLMLDLCLAVLSLVWVTARSQNWHFGLMELRTESVLLGSKSGPNMITELSGCSQNMDVVI